jgi:hypothetical protein
MVTHDPRAAAHGERSLHLDKGALEREEMTPRIGVLTPAVARN